MASVRRVAVGVCATLLICLSPAAHAQLQVDAFDVEQVQRLDAGTPLYFSLYGSPGAAVTLHIDGAKRLLELRERQPGIYEGVYTIDEHDHIRADAQVVAHLRRGGLATRWVLEESLLLGGAAHAGGPPAADEPSIAWSTPSATAPADTGSVKGPPVAAMRRATEPVCDDCAVVESMRVVDVGRGDGIAGAIAGGVIGAIVGDQVGRGSDDRGIARLIGVLGGLLAGREIERNASRRLRYDVVLRMPDGSAQMRSYYTVPPFQVGDRVRP